MVSDISVDIILAFPNHAIQFVYNVLGCGAFMEAQYSISALHKKRRSCWADLHEHQGNRYYVAKLELSVSRIFFQIRIIIFSGNKANCTASFYLLQIK